MKNELEVGQVNESGSEQIRITNVHVVGGSGTGGEGGEEGTRVQVIVARMVEITEVVDEAEVPPTNMNEQQADPTHPTGTGTAQLAPEHEPPANPTIACLVCCTSFRQSTAFSRKKKLTSNYCGKVWKIFCRLLSPQMTPSAQEFSFEQYPLPFCTKCAKTVIGLAKMQEELEMLQSTINFGMCDILEKIKSTDICSVKPGLQEYADKIEDVRSYALREFESKSSQKTGKVKAYGVEMPGEGAEEFQGSPESPEEDPLDVDLYLYPLGTPTSKRRRKTTPLADSMPVKLENSQIQVSEGFQTIHEIEKDTERPSELGIAGSLIGSTTSDEGHAELDKPAKKDPKVEALAKKLSACTRRSILQRRRKELKRKARERKLEPYGPVIEMKDGRLFFGNVTISQEEVNGVNKYKCEYCGALRKSLGLMRRHIRQAHKNGNKHQYHCKICGKELTNIGSLPRHMTVFHSSKGKLDFPCDICGKILRSTRTLECHKALVHSVGMENYSICDICGRPFRSMTNMKQHRLTHMSAEESAEFKLNGEESQEPSARIFDCEYCGKRLSSGGAYRQHLMIHEEVLPFTCDVCGWGFRHKCNLQAHLELHRGEERELKFKCDVPECGRAYPTKTQLFSHSFTHRSPEEKPFKCIHPGCSMGFARAYDLNNHRRTHTGERPYKCTMCPKTFTRSHHLSRHFLKLHNPNAETTELITAEIVEPTSNMTIEFVITGAEGETFTLPDLKL